MPKASDHIVIIGGTAGIGLAIAHAAYALGCQVTIGGRDAERAARIAATVGPQVRSIGIDLNNSSSIRAALAEGPTIQHLVITSIHRVNTSITDFAVREAEILSRLKLVGYPEAVHAALPRLASDASVVLFGGVSKVKPYPGSSMVSAVNAGVLGLTATMAVELAPRRVNCISPGMVPDSPAWEPLIAKGGNEVFEHMAALTPSRRLASVADIVHGVFFLLDNPAVNGIDLEIDGGIRLV